MKFPIKVRRAIRQFLRQRLVIWRRATDCSRDVKILQNQTVIAVGAERLAGETNLVQHWIHEIAGSVSGERASGAVGSMSSRSQPKHDDASVGITEAWHRFAPVLPLAVSAALFDGDLLAIGNQARTASTGNDFSV